ncbi:DUF1638 domain-containing protein [bacterium]|nr:DUF1638 domain-containing protein [bacterium]
MNHQLQIPHDLKRTKVIACATVVEEMLPFIPDGLAYERLDFGLHVDPKNLKQALQDAVDRNCKEFDTIILGYGLCSMAVVGLKSRRCNLIVPKVDDCIAIFLGSGQTYYSQAKKEPGTYYLTKGWIEVSDTLLDEFHRIVNKYGKERTAMIMKAMLKNYKRLVYIDTGADDQNGYKEYAQKTAEHFGLQFEEIQGSDSLVKKMIFGPWDDEFVIISPGQRIKYTDFKTPIGCEHEKK